VAEGRGPKLAVCDPQRSLTYSELLEASARVGSVLSPFGVQPENRIALVLFVSASFRCSSIPG